MVFFISLRHDCECLSGFRYRFAGWVWGRRVPESTWATESKERNEAREDIDDIIVIFDKFANCGTIL